MPEKTTIARKRSLMYLIGFFFNLSAAVPTYFNSLFLAEVLKQSPALNGNADKFVGIIYAASALMSIFCFVEIPTALKRFGNFKTAVGLIGLEIASLAGLSLLSDNLTLAIIFSFIANFVTISLVNFCLDIFLESYSSDTKTGRIRGAFLTSSNMAWLIAPLIAPLVIQSVHYDRLYVLSAILLLPVMSLIFTGLKGFRDPGYDTVPFWRAFNEIWKDRNVKGILMAQFLLQFFYSWMVIYTPIYLKTVVGFDEVTIGIIFFVMLIPFILIEVPLGRLADSRWGEKEMLSAGFVIMAIFTGLIAFVTDHNVALWAGILFMTRVGAATVEIMAETYFFKKVNASRTYLISFARMTRPFAYVVGPVLATLLFTVFDMKGLFIFLGFLMLYGLRYSLSIEDTR